MKASEKRFTGLSAAEKKKVAAIGKPKRKEPSVIFEEGGTIYFCKKETKAKCFSCGKVFQTGDAYRVSRDGGHFKHVECESC